MVDADDIAKLARSLVTDTASEVRIRCAVSRSYYAAYHYCLIAAEKWCDKLSEQDKEGHNTHAQLYIRLEKYAKDSKIQSDLTLAAAEAKKLRSLRVDADYHLNKSIDQKTFLRSLSLLSTVKSYLDTIT